MSNDQSFLAQRCAIVTGASSGIGFATASRLLCGGATVVASGRRAEGLEQLRGVGAGRLVTVCGDITDKGHSDAILDAVHAASGRPPDLCVVSAGRGLPGTVLKSDESQWDDLFNINVLAVMRQLRRFTEALREVGSSLDVSRDIVVLGSTIGRIVSPFNPVYGATKFALHSAVEALRREVCAEGIRVTLIEPGIVQTAFQANAGYAPQWFESYAAEIGPVLQADDVADAIVFAVTRPPHVHLNDIVIRPTRQPVP